MNSFREIDSLREIPARLELEHLLWRQGYHTVAGVDEAGRGPLAGPVVAAALVFPRYLFCEEVRDSKLLSASRREKLYGLLLESAAAYGVGVVSHREIDSINIRQATFKAMRKAIGNLGIQPDYILFDGYELPERIYRQEAVTAGDDHSFTIAAASIVAKVTRDRLMIEYHKKYPDYGFDRHKGYGTAQHRELIRKYGPCSIHRQSFLKKILNQ